MKVGTVFDAHVRDLTSEGRAVVSAPNGRTVFVGGLWPGESAKVRVTALKGRVGFAEVLELISASPHRRKPLCRFHGNSPMHCGGCPWIFVDYAAQLEAKQYRVESTLARLSSDIPVAPIIPSESELGYRNRVQFKTDGRTLGFVAAKSNALVDVEDCVVLSDVNRFSLKKLREKLPHNAWRPRNRQKWTRLDLDEHTTAANVSVDQRLGFHQGNTAQNHRMRAWLRDVVSTVKDKSIALELFCGSGNFTDILSEAGFEKILAVEGQSEAVSELNARNLAGVSTQVCDLFDETAFASLMHANQDARFLLLDPPRDGLKCRSGLFSADGKLIDVVYISCDLATFTRDLRAFLDAGFKVKTLQPLDQFPQTPHIEILCHLHR